VKPIRLIEADQWQAKLIHELAKEVWMCWVNNRTQFMDLSRICQSRAIMTSNHRAATVKFHTPRTTSSSRLYICRLILTTFTKSLHKVQFITATSWAETKMKTKTILQHSLKEKEHLHRKQEADSSWTTTSSRITTECFKTQKTIVSLIIERNNK